VWAQDTPPAGCVLAQDNWLFVPGYDPHYYYLFFRGSPTLPIDAPVYGDAWCAGDPVTGSSAVYVLAADEAGAQALCDTTDPGTLATSTVEYGGDPRVWFCGY
jgi:hypothetical protein